MSQVYNYHYLCRICADPKNEAEKNHAGKYENQNRAEATAVILLTEIERLATTGEGI